MGRVGPSPDSARHGGPVWLDHRPGAVGLVESRPLEVTTALEAGAAAGVVHQNRRIMRAPIATSPDQADIVMVGVPFDGGVTNRPGARHGPRELRT